MTKEWTARVDDYFGLCPECYAYPARRNIKKSNMMLCERCRVKWEIGSIFKDWRYETEEDWEKNREFLKDFREVEPCSIESKGERVFEAKRERRKKAERTVMIWEKADGWWVIKMPEKLPENEIDRRAKIMGPFRSPEAAECVQREIIEMLESCGYLPSDWDKYRRPDKYWEALGRLLRFLRDNKAKSLEELAEELMRETPWKDGFNRSTAVLGGFGNAVDSIPF